jgi:hypothetical protein
MSANQASAAIPQRVAIILTGPNDWDEWIEVVKTKAKAGEIWQYIDPSTAKDQLPNLERPSILINQTRWLDCGENRLALTEAEV